MKEVNDNRTLLLSFVPESLTPEQVVVEVLADENTINRKSWRGSKSLRRATSLFFGEMQLLDLG